MTANIQQNVTFIIPDDKQKSILKQDYILSILIKLYKHQHIIFCLLENKTYLNYLSDLLWSQKIFLPNYKGAVNNKIRQIYLDTEQKSSKGATIILNLNTKVIHNSNCQVLEWVGQNNIEKQKSREKYTKYQHILNSKPKTLRISYGNDIPA